MYTAHSSGAIVSLRITLSSIWFCARNGTVYCHSWVRIGLTIRITVGTIGSSISIDMRSEEHTSELQSLMRISHAGLCLKKNRNTKPSSTKTHIVNPETVTKQ